MKDNKSENSNFVKHLKFKTMSKEKTIKGKELQPESLMMSYGYDPMLSEGSIKCPIFQTSTFVFNNAER